MPFRSTAVASRLSRRIAPGAKTALVLALLGTIPTGAQVIYEPTLRIESGMHTARSDEIGVDADGRTIVSGSVDKTVRLWNAATGLLVRTIYIPDGPGFEGQIYATAISPDGQTIAVGGWTVGSA